jgi:hypothetical protein
MELTVGTTCYCALHYKYLQLMAAISTRYFLQISQGRPSEHVEPGVPPFVQQRDHILRDLAFCKEHL